ncbi:MAG TPA: threonine-phosphate decarboxylase CobD [Bacillota bacterium]|nr:threonine-phosphate decarboxylase CobD [Bacillota bacterium]
MEIKHVHGGNLWDAADKNGLNPRELLDFSANINPQGASRKAVEAIGENLDTIVHYPDPDCRNLKNKLSAHTGIPVDNMLMGNGAVELIYLLLATIKSEKVLIPAPTFGEYESAVQIAGGQVVDYYLPAEKGYAIQVAEVLERLPLVDMVVLCNPNNPTGTLLTSEEVLTIIRAAQAQGVFVMVDEAFLDFRPDRELYSVAKYVQEHDNLFVSYSLTKFLGIPGLRLGAGFANQDLTQKLNARKDPWNVNCLAQVAGEVSLQDQAYMDSTLKLVAAEKGFLFNSLRDIPGLLPFPPSVNYIMVKLLNGMTAKELQQVLIGYKIMVRDCSSYKNLDETFIRVAVKDRGSNERLIAALGEICKEV